ncbi:hypothetical protein B0F90DRAFT_1712057 [Multifurca ochricompacta]|uniref:Uncharacterized protein n=1 Tax=Multifurca ochricompacta TaxID=376703 RepID=A0AAD4M590_9AGAM|nr:hypothetical protein B0F90DRAFT_1712057 [Multifurca ochricompacta]
MSKRTFSQVESSSPTQPSSSSPLKRLHTSTPASRSTPSSLLSTPYTPSVYSIPADSPTNPLGLKRRVNNLTLPKATPFSKHVALRFQLMTTVDDTLPPKHSLWNTSQNPTTAEYTSQGTYRIVQVPLSYTFRHLRALILFLFSGDPAAPPCVPGHLFAVHHGINISAPGEIVCGRVRVKLSRARDPYYSSRSLADLIAAADALGQGEEELEDEEEDASWRWEGEDDFTLGHVWEVRARDPKRGIIYYHDDTTTVHITLNTQSVPHRKGVGNMPFVFRAYVPPPPARIFPAYKPPVPKPPDATLSSTTIDTKPRDGAGGTDIDIDDSSSSEEDDFDGGLNTRVWNHIGAFTRFLSLMRARARSAASAASSSSASSSASSHSPSPTVPPSPSSPILSSPPPTRRGIRRASTIPYANAGPSSCTTSSIVSLSLPTTTRPGPQTLPSLTPAPARARTRYRVARAARRLLGLTERGLESEAAEEADVVEGRVLGQSKKGLRKGDKDRKKEKGGRAERERDQTKMGSKGDADEKVWNPFAHLKDA